MDAFKTLEIKQMTLGGNQAWKDFYNAHSSHAFDDSSIRERYDCETGEEYKERLRARAEDREFDPAEFKKELEAKRTRIAQKALSGTGSGINSTSGSRTQSPAPSRGAGIDPSQRAQNEAFFARMGSANASRPENLPPSQGGKYGGFGSAMPEPTQQETTIPGAQEFQKDPIGALTKGFGWFATAVTKQAKVVNDAYIQPTARNLASSDIAGQAQRGLTTAASTVSSAAQTGLKGAQEGLSKFVEGETTTNTRKTAEPERKDFWDSFGGLNETRASNVGTSAIKKGTNNDKTAPVTKKKDDGWGDDW